MPYSHLHDRFIIAISGEDSRSFLQGIISNDIYKVTATDAIYALILTPQGKYLHDLFIIEHEGKLLLDVAAGRMPELLRKLAMYKLRSKVIITDESEHYAVIASQDELSSFPQAISYIDPRSELMGVRAIIAKDALEHSGFPQDNAAYDIRRINASVAEGEKDLMPEKSFPLEYGMEVLHAVDFKKGCYVGQEVTARTKYRGVVRKGIYRVTGNSELPAIGAEIMANGKKLGVMCSHVEQEGLALLRREEYETAKANGDILQAETVEIQVLDKA